jgi:hypothetical protein
VNARTLFTCRSLKSWLTSLLRRLSVAAIFKRFKTRLHDDSVHVWVGVIPHIIARAKTENCELQKLIQHVIARSGASTHMSCCIR